MAKRPRKCPRCRVEINNFLVDEYWCDYCDVTIKIPTDEIIDREERI